MQEQHYSVEHRKFNLINLITQLEDLETLAAIEILLTPKKEEDWWDTISEEERKAVDEGLAPAPYSETCPKLNIKSHILAEREPVATLDIMFALNGIVLSVV
ncbi:MAG: hypothetical protein F6K17_31570, partial [Okeania sp. SIO3C4]|nr:hypothetical protein [Okeania sp. SIO3C4]